MQIKNLRGQKIYEYMESVTKQFGAEFPHTKSPPLKEVESSKSGDAWTARLISTY